MAEKLVVTVLQKGPLRIQNASRLRYRGKLIEQKGDAFLCRCGFSKKAPFCDGSHKANGFTGESDAPAATELRVWEGSQVRTFFNQKTCMHVFKCAPLKELRERELAGDAAAAAEIIRVVLDCPSGALSYERKGGAAETASDQSAGSSENAPECDVDIIEGGEVRLTAPFTINVDLHEGQDGTRATLCRCGQSKNKPWCDGRHRQRKDFV